MRISGESLSGNAKLLISIIIIASVFVILTYLTGGVRLTIIETVIICIILIITKSIWLSRDHGKNMIRNASLAIAISAVGSYTFWNSIVSSLINDIVPGLNIGGSQPSVVVLVFLLAVIFIVNYFIRDRSVMTEHVDPINKEFPEKDFLDRLLLYTKVLKNELDNIDLETNWSDTLFTPLDAEVEVVTRNKRLKKVTDLLKAVKSDRKSQTFLIIGDPGSGKSTALRKLARELLDEVNDTGRVPIYINLKEWQTESKWTEENPPTKEKLYHFILQNIKKRGDVFANDFIDLYFKKMFVHGRFFFLLDSFDEIPDILDASEASWILDELSSVLYDFLAGSHNSRGILSSRIFRRPTPKFKCKTTLEIRPFSEAKIEKAFRKAILNIKPDFFVNFFTNYKHLISIAKNPFCASLIIRYLKENNYSFPENQAD
jgi:hypothetical protein